MMVNVWLTSCKQLICAEVHVGSRFQRVHGIADVVHVGKSLNDKGDEGTTEKSPTKAYRPGNADRGDGKAHKALLVRRCGQKVLIVLGGQ